MFSFLFSLFFIFFRDFSHYAKFYALFVFCYIPCLPNNTKIFVHIKIFLFLKGNTLPRICLAVRRNCRPLRWDTLGNCFASLTEIKSLTMLSETESGKQLCPMMISWPRKKHKLKWFGHVSRSSGLLQGTVQGERRRCRKKKPWQNNISEWTGLSLRRPKWSWKQNQMEGKGC